MVRLGRRCAGVCKRTDAFVVTSARLTCVVLVSGGAHVPLLPARTAASLYSYHSDGAHLRCGVVVCASVQRLRDCVGVASVLVSRAEVLAQFGAIVKL